ncbi:ABC transporter ATP-binding protein [candidate division KSB1 bacterium]|nr:ABC transporter ATP-binding protein [candidate division KSB1 bacterium]
MSQLRVSRLSFAYRDSADLIGDVNLFVNTGETVALIGPNGAGKTTLLRLIAGLLAPVAGDISVDASSALAARNSIGVILQNPDHQMLADTVENELALGLEFRGVPSAEIQTRVETALRQFNLADLRMRQPQRLSGGQKQRVALAAIMISNPAFLLLDEPDSFLDAPSRASFRAALEQVRPRTGCLWALPRLRADIPVDRWYLLNQRTVIETDPDSIRSELAARSRAGTHA